MTALTESPVAGVAAGEGRPADVQGKSATAGRPILRIVVYGNPAPQGSKRHVGHGVMVESSKNVKPWRQDVVAAAREAIQHQMTLRAALVRGDHWTPFDGPLAVTMVFTFVRPRSHYRTGRNAHLLRDGAPVQPCTPPDLDKTARSTSDALVTAGAIKDDARIAEYDRLAKVWAGSGDRHALDSPGCLIEIRTIT